MKHVLAFDPLGLGSFSGAAAPRYSPVGSVGDPDELGIVHLAPRALADPSAIQFAVDDDLAIGQFFEEEVAPPSLPSQLLPLSTRVEVHA